MGSKPRKLTLTGRRSARSETTRKSNSTSTSVFARFRTMGGLVPASEELLGALADLSERSGRRFEISPQIVPGTNLYVVHTNEHEFRSDYTVGQGVLGFRVPSN